MSGEINSARGAGSSSMPPGGGGSRSGEGGDLYRLDLFGELHQEALAEEERVYKVCVFVGRFVLCR